MKLNCRGGGSIEHTGAAPFVRRGDDALQSWPPDCGEWVTVALPGGAVEHIARMPRPPRRSNSRPGELRDHWRTNRDGKQPDWIEGACGLLVRSSARFGLWRITLVCYEVQSAK
jgi:hypothetical protein